MRTRRTGRPGRWLAGLGAGVVAAVVLSATLLVRDPTSVQPAPGVVHSSSPPPANAVPDTRPHRAAVRAGVRTIQAYLDSYRRDGIVVAARRYLPADSQPESAVGVPRLVSGSVDSAEVSSWESADHFTLEVGLDLHFDGDPLAWDQGNNDRFVTLTRAGGHLRIAEIATSP